MKTRTFSLFSLLVVVSMLVGACVAVGLCLWGDPRAPCQRLVGGLRVDPPLFFF